MSEAKKKFLGLFRSKSAAEKREKDTRDVLYFSPMLQMHR